MRTLNRGRLRPWCCTCGARTARGRGQRERFASPPILASRFALKPMWRPPLGTRSTWVPSMGGASLLGTVVREPCRHGHHDVRGWAPTRGEATGLPVRHGSWLDRSPQVRTALKNAAGDHRNALRLAHFLRRVIATRRAWRPEIPTFEALFCVKHAFPPHPVALLVSKPSEMCNLAPELRRFCGSSLLGKIRLRSCEAQEE